MSKIIDNRRFGTVGAFLQENIKDGSKMDVVSAYFTIYAYQRLKGNLNNIEQMRFLFGEPTFIKNVGDNAKDNRSHKIEFDREDECLKISVVDRLMQKSIARECYNWINDKLEIKSMVKPNFLHGKMYHIHQPSTVQKAITGSSNFTVNGLGLGGRPNIELNTVIDGDQDRLELNEWFESIWNDESGLVEDVKEEVLSYLKQLYQENSPEFIYYKTLFHIFGDDTEDYIDNNNKLMDSEIWKALYEFQKVGVRGIIKKMEKYNGCILADSVGLGKTFEALAIIKYYQHKNKEILVICPKKLSDNWTIYQAKTNDLMNPFSKDRLNFSVMYHTDMGRTSGKSLSGAGDFSRINWDAYDLVIIDESHNFRGNVKVRDNEEGGKDYNRAGWLMEKIIKSGNTTKVLMLSATPVNNTLKDLRNQISFISQEEDYAFYDGLGIISVADLLKKAQTQFSSWADPDKNPNRDSRKLMDKLDPALFTLLDAVTIARSRKQVQKSFDMAEIGKFPTRNKPQSIYPNIDLENKFPTYDKLKDSIQEYKLSLFNPFTYLNKDAETQAKYIERTKGKVSVFIQKDRETSLTGMMRVNFMKRLESSINSFAKTINNTIFKIDALILQLNTYVDNGARDEFTLDLVEENDDDFDTVGKLKFELKDINCKEWLNELERDKNTLSQIHKQAVDVTPDRDEKLSILKKIIADKVNTPTNGTNKKILIFTAFADTANYLYANILEHCKSLDLNVGLVCGGHCKTTFGRNEFASILTNFSPISKNRIKLLGSDQSSEIDVLIGTDCISEGQNLQDCDLVVNYDIHWNPVRLIQRYGRIDRIGSVNDIIHLVNFWPTEDFDKYINLKSRVEARMALTDMVATGDDNILDPHMEELIAHDSFRDKQLKRLKEEPIDLEDLTDGVNMMDFSLEDYRTELALYKELNQGRLEKSPIGMAAIIPAPSNVVHCKRTFTSDEKSIIRSGVIYCLRIREDQSIIDKHNPISPYFLLYIADDGEIKFAYTKVKKILEIYRALCIDEKSAYDKLCDEFNVQSNNGTQLMHYERLLGDAVMSAMKTYKKNTLKSLTTDKRGIISPMPKVGEILEKFELVTWLVIKGE